MRLVQVKSPEEASPPSLKPKCWLLAAEFLQKNPPHPSLALTLAYFCSDEFQICSEEDFFGVVEAAAAVDVVAVVAASAVVEAGVAVAAAVVAVVAAVVIAVTAIVDADAVAAVIVGAVVVVAFAAADVSYAVVVIVVTGDAFAAAAVNATAVGAGVAAAFCDLLEVFCCCCRCSEQHLK